MGVVTAAKIYNIMNANNAIVNEIATKHTAKNKSISYNTMETEAESLLIREKNLFMLNSVLTIALIITIFKVI